MSIHLMLRIGCERKVCSMTLKCKEDYSEPKLMLFRLCKKKHFSYVSV